MMPRKPRLYSPDIAYHFITRGNNRQVLFKKEEDFKFYLFWLHELLREFNFKIFHYCLMSNHVHMLIQFEDERAFFKVPQKISLTYAKYFQRNYKHVGHVFQDRFKGIPVEDNTYLLECGRYIERNPYKAKMVIHPKDYQWSSASYYLGGIEDRLIVPNPMYLDLSPSPPQRIKLYDHFVMQDRPYEKAMERVIFGRHQW